MKYIRTKDGSIYEVIKENDRGFVVEDFFDTDEPPYCKSELIVVLPNWVHKQSDNIEELCDVFDVYRKWNGHNCFDQTRAEMAANKAFQYAMEEYNAYKDDGDDIIWFKGAIWTNKGLIYVAKMNDKGNWELL